ncbi:hypothetical protein MASR2M69_16170 [Bacteroidota bacterium]
MRRCFFTLGFFTLLFVLFTTVTYSQVPVVEFDKMVHDFGDIMLKSGKHTHTFNFKNIGKQPVVIQTVISSCGCTVPEWTKSPVMPGASGKIKITFLNDQGPYPFDKSLTVFVTGVARPIILRIKGVVHDKQKTLKELYPERFAEAGFRSSVIDLDNISQGDTRNEIIEFANLSQKTIEVSFTPVSKGLNITANPSKIEPGAKSQMQVTLNTKEEINWGDTEYNAKVLINGKEVTGKFLRIFANIRDNFADMTKEDIENAPLPMANTSSFDFGKVKAGTEITTTFKIRNIGKKDLLIHKIDTGDKKVTAKYVKKIASGEAGNVEIKINTTDEFGEKGFILALITNSPSRPIVNLVITGNVIK